MRVCHDSFYSMQCNFGFYFVWNVCGRLHPQLYRKRVAILANSNSTRLWTSFGLYCERGRITWTTLSGEGLTLNALRITPGIWYWCITHAEQAYTNSISRWGHTPLSCVYLICIDYWQFSSLEILIFNSKCHCNFKSVSGLSLVGSVLCVSRH